MCGGKEIGAVTCEIAYSILNKTNAAQAMLHAKNTNNAHLSSMPGYTTLYAKVCSNFVFVTYFNSFSHLALRYIILTAM